MSVTLNPVGPNGEKVLVERHPDSARDIYVSIDAEIETADGTGQIRYKRNHYRLPDEVSTPAEAREWLLAHFRRLVAHEKEAIAARAQEARPLTDDDDPPNLGITLDGSDLDA